MCRCGGVLPDIGAIALFHPLPVPVGLQQQGGVGPGGEQWRQGIGLGGHAHAGL